MLPRSYLACGHEKGEEEDERALPHWQPVGLLKGEEDGSIQAGFGRAAHKRVCLFIIPPGGDRIQKSTQTSQLAINASKIQL